MLTLESWTPNPANLINAGMVKLADTTDLGSVAERCAGSSPVTGTKGLCDEYAKWSEAIGSDIDRQERSITCLI